MKHFVASIDNLSYVHRVSISANEKMLLLISTKNIFYLINLEDFSVVKHTIRGKYNGDLDNTGCWGLQDDAAVLPVFNRKTLTHTLRRYKINESFSYEDFGEGKYRIVDIQPVRELNKYMLIGFDRNKSMQDRFDSWNILWFDGCTIEEYPVRRVADDDVRSAEYDAETNTVIVYSFERTIRCDIHGRYISDIFLPGAERITRSFSDVFAEMTMKKEIFEEIKTFSKALHMEDMTLKDSINKICSSYDRRKMYIATYTGFYVINMASQKVEAKKKIDYGVQDIREVSPNRILISTWGGVKLFELIP